ncbi:MAG: serine dehydratase, partial [Verrucomicrobiota bacterium]|nr:serine dehydratase [Verrucomicrobiota bacterium]
MDSFPSIFNDVLGPVMRGPSSSHSAASLRIGRMALDLMDSDIKSVTVDYDPKGSLVTTHLSQGSDLGLTGGILGWETDDPRLPNYRDEVIKAGIEINVRYLDYGADHPNTYQLRLRGNQHEHSMTAISTGGGMIEVQKIDDIPVRMKGDYYETVIFLKKSDESLSTWLLNDESFDEVDFIDGEKKSLINLKSREIPNKNTLDKLNSCPSVLERRVLKPVL